MEAVQLDVFKSAAARDSGMKRATDHADSVNAGWSDEAYKLLKQFVKDQYGEFQAEDLRSYAALIDFPLPPHNRAWGSIMVRGARAGIIKRVGYAPVKNVRAHRANATVWIKSI